MSIDALHHVMIAIPSGTEAIAREFYGSLLALPEIPKPDSLRGRGGLWFRAGNRELHLGVDQNFHAARKAHVAFEVENFPDFRQKILDRGYSVIDDDLLPGFDRFYLDDPFGNRLEFLAASLAPPD